MTRLTLEQRKIQLWAGSSCCFQGDTGCSKRTQRSGKENRRHGNRAAPRLCFGSCGMECMGLGDGGWDTGKSPLHTSPSPKQPPQDHTERFSTTSGGFQTNKLRVMQSIAFLTVTPPKKTWAQGFLVWRSLEMSGIQMLYVNSFDSTSPDLKTQGVPYSCSVLEVTWAEVILLHQIYHL